MACGVDSVSDVILYRAFLLVAFIPMLIMFMTFGAIMGAVAGIDEVFNDFKFNWKETRFIAEARK